MTTGINFLLTLSAIFSAVKDAKARNLDAFLHVSFAKPSFVFNVIVVRDVKSHFLLSFPVRLIITFEKIYQYVVGVFNKTIIPFALVGYEKVIANSAAPR